MPDADRLFLDAADKLKETVRQGLVFEAAQVKVIGLEHIRSAAGNSWTQMSERIRRNSMSFIEGCLSAGDIVLPCGDGFLVIYAHQPENARDLAQECLVIQEALDTFYIGEHGMEMLRAQVDAQSVQASDISALLSQDPINAAKRTSPPIEHGIAFLPVWSAEREILGIYMATPSYGVRRQTCLGYDPDYRETGRLDRHDFADLDMRMLDRVAALTKTAERGVVSYAVHSTTMQRRSTRGAFLAKLMDIPEERRRHMIGRIAEIEPGTPIVTIADWVHQLRAFTQRVAIEMHPSEKTLTALESVGAWSVGFVLTAAMQTPAYRPGLEASIRRWAAQGQRQNIKLGIFGIKDPQIFSTCMKAGVDYCGSERVWPGVATPGGVWQLPKSAFLQALADSHARLAARQQEQEAPAYYCPSP